MTRRSCLIVMLLLAAGAMPARAQFSALPGVLHLGAEDDADIAVVQVRNEGERPLQLRMYLSDYDQAEDGAYVFQAPGAVSGSCAGRISFFPDNALLEPGERQEIQVRIEAGADACWSLLFIESAPGREQAIDDVEGGADRDDFTAGLGADRVLLIGAAAEGLGRQVVVQGAHRRPPSIALAMRSSAVAMRLSSSVTR